jgi:ABC-type lipoprotein release transport system permease subunit
MLKFGGLVRLADDVIKWLGVTGLCGYLLALALIAIRAPREPVPEAGEIYRVALSRGGAGVYVTASVQQLMVTWFIGLLVILVLLALIRSILKTFAPLRRTSRAVVLEKESVDPADSIRL